MLSNVHLILFFDIYNVIKLTKSCQVDFDVQHSDQGDARGEGATSTEREIQTELHPIPCRKDESYVWNLWDYRRKAIELVSGNLNPSCFKLLNAFIPGESPSQEDDFRSNVDVLSQTRHWQSATRGASERSANRRQPRDEH